jgi:hypothetical protein
MTAISPEPPVGIGGSHGGARKQGFADRRVLADAPLPAPRPRAEGHSRDGRLRRDGYRTLV